MADSRTGQLWLLTVGSLLALFVITAVLAMVDRRLLDGASVWAKPLKFELSIALHFGTLVLVVGALGPAWRNGTLLWVVGVAASAATVFEMAYILLQAGRQQASHFNLDTPLHATLYGLMAAGAVVITLAAALVGVVAWIDGEAGFGAGTRLGIGLGLAGGALLTLVAGFAIGGALGHHVGVEPAGGARMFLTGWSLTVGDRRVPHFFATHMMQALPLAGLIADKVLPPAVAQLAVAATAIAWTIVTIALLQQAGAGLPIYRG
ncbi:hypothetical protein [Reyranella sp.]|uniref:hypothetical protein n=1 Tax=Reyranella sp. TaxID=1929291 RepID=UPI003BAC6967